MSIAYYASARIPMHDAVYERAEVQHILDELRAYWIDSIFAYEADMLDIVIDSECSCASADRTEEQIMRLAEYASDAFVLETESEGERATLYLGPKGAALQMHAAALETQIHELMLDRDRVLSELEALSVNAAA